MASVEPDPNELLGSRLCLRRLRSGDRCHEYLTRQGDGTWLCSDGHRWDRTGNLRLT